MFFRSSREKQTTVLCPECAKALLIKRTCHEAYMYCGHCEKSFELKDFYSANGRSDGRIFGKSLFKQNLMHGI